MASYLNFWAGVCVVHSFLTLMATGAPTLDKRHELTSQSQRVKRQIFFNDFAANRKQLFFPADSFIGPNSFPRAQKRRLDPGQPLIFSNGAQNTFSTTTTMPTTAVTLAANSQQNNNSGELNVVFVNNQPAVVTMAPFITPTPASALFLDCFGNCPTTSEYNPICASNQQQYHNQQKFDCALRCGADIQIVRRGSCQGLFPMQRG